MQPPGICIDAGLAREHDAGMSDAFDGAGREFREPTFRAAVAVLVASLIAIALVWLAASWALNQQGSPTYPPAGDPPAQQE